jgi:hypothetical protein
MGDEFDNLVAQQREPNDCQRDDTRNEDSFERPAHRRIIRDDWPQEQADRGD